MIARSYPMADDAVLGDGGNLTIYERPDGSRYALDKRGHGQEWPADEPIFGRARFDSRDLASGRWPASASREQQPAPAGASPRGWRRPSHRSGTRR